MLGNLVGSWIAYAVGYYGTRLDLLEKNKLIHISPKHLKWADSWFERYGAPTVFFSRMLPIIRTFISLPAGVAKMPFWRFSLYTLAGSIPWVLALAIVGEKVGDNWEDWRHKLGYLDYVVLAAIVIGVVYLVVKRLPLRRRHSGGGEALTWLQVSSRPLAGSITLSRIARSPSRTVSTGTSWKIGFSSWARCRL